jgi:hypothetical protein
MPTGEFKTFHGDASNCVIVRESESEDVNGSIDTFNSDARLV